MVKGGGYRRSLQASALLVASSLMFPAATWALNNASTWAREKNPLYARGYGSTGHGYGFWSVVRTGDGTVSRATGTTFLDFNADNHRIFFSTQSQSNAGRCRAGTSLAFDFMGTGGAYGESYSCTQDFFDYESEVQSEHHQRRLGKAGVTASAVNPNGSVMRARVKVCLDIPWRPDPCSGWNFSGADRY